MLAAGMEIGDIWPEKEPRLTLLCQWTEYTQGPVLAEGLNLYSNILSNPNTVGHLILFKFRKLVPKKCPKLPPYVSTPVGDLQVAFPRGQVEDPGQ